MGVVIEDFAGFLLEDWLLLLSRHLLILPIFLVLAAVVYGSLASIITTARGKFTRPAFFRGTLPRNCQHSSWQNRYLVAFGWEAAKGGQVRFQCRAERVCVRKDCCAAYVLALKFCDNSSRDDEERQQEREHVNVSVCLKGRTTD